MEKNVIYLDNAATTKMFEECVDVHKHFSCVEFSNPSTMSLAASQITAKIAHVERKILKVLDVDDGNVIFTSGATESNNLAIKGSFRNGDCEYVFTAGEHSSVFNVAKKMQQEGKNVVFVPLSKDGCCDLNALEQALTAKTRLLSTIFVSNETGAISNLQKIAQIRNKKCPKAVWHIDGVQAFMKIPFSLRGLGVDLFSFSGHKFHAPKGVGGLYVRNKASLKAIFEGGGQQYGLRSGTENVSSIMQLEKAIDLIDVSANYDKVSKLKRLFISTLEEKSGVKVRDFEGSPYILNLIFPDVKGETMLHALDEKGVVIGLGSACGSKTVGNRVLENIGMNAHEVVSSGRISFNAHMTEDEVESAAKIIASVYDEVCEKLS